MGTSHIDNESTLGNKHSGNLPSNISNIIKSPATISPMSPQNWAISPAPSVYGSSK